MECFCLRILKNPLNREKNSLCRILFLKINKDLHNNSKENHHEKTNSIVNSSVTKLFR